MKSLRGSARIATRVASLTLALLALSAPALATDAMNPVAFDARSAGMGGADTAVALTTLSVATNPAGITQFGMRVDGSVSLLVPMLNLSDRVTGPQPMDLNTDVSGETKVFPLFGVGFSSHIWEGLYGGIGVFVQGGMGADFRGLATFADDDPSQPLATQPSPATYDVFSQIQYMKFAPTLAYNYDFFSVGASLHLGLSKMQWRHGGMQFPEMDGDHVYAPHDVDFASDWTFGVAGRFGVLFKFFDDDLRFGASYMMQAKPKYEGTMKVDGMLEYDASTDDFGWARELSVGVAGQLFDDRLLLSADFRWAQWSEAVNVVTFEASAKDPTTAPQGMAQLEMPFQMKWRDSYVVAVGAEYAAMKDFLFVRLGYNWGRAVVTPEGINPLFPPVVEHHVTAGLGLQNIVGGLGVDIAFEYAIPGEVKSDETNQMGYEPSMPGATPSPNGYRVDVGMQQLTAYLMVNYTF